MKLKLPLPSIASIKAALFESPFLDLQLPLVMKGKGPQPSLPAQGMSPFFQYLFGADPDQVQVLLPLRVGAL